MKFYMIIVSFADADEAERVVSELFERRLIACAQLQDVRSRYVWQGKLERDDEVVAFLKTRAELYDRVEACVKEMHSYEVPEIIAVSIEKGSKDYLKWIEENTGDFYKR